MSWSENDAKRNTGDYSAYGEVYGSRMCGALLTAIDVLLWALYLAAIAYVATHIDLLAWYRP